MPLGLGLRQGLYAHVQEFDALNETMELVRPIGGQPLWNDVSVADPNVFPQGMRQVRGAGQKHGGLGNAVGMNALPCYGIPRTESNGKSRGVGEPSNRWGLPKTIEYFAASNLVAVNTDTTLAAATVYSTTMVCTIDEKIRRDSAFLSVRMIFTFAGGWTANNGITGTRVTAKLGTNQAISYDRSHATTQVSGRPNFYEIDTDVTQVFRDQYLNGVGSSDTLTGTIAVSTASAMTVTGHTCKVVITYAYDPAVQIPTSVNDDTGYYYTKTIRIPVQSHLTTLTTSQQETGADGTLGKTNQLPNLSTLLPEANVYFRSVFLETMAMTTDSSTSDITPYVQIGAAAEVARATLERGNWTGASCWWRDHFDLSGYTATNTSINWRCDVTGRMQQICAFIVVTYSYRADTTSTIICEGHWPLTSSLGSADVAVALQNLINQPASFRMVAELDIPEPSPTIKQSAIVMNYGAAGTAPSISMQSGTQGAFRPYVSGNSIGPVQLIHRIDDGWTLRQGINQIGLEFIGATGNRTPSIVDAYAHVLYTVDLTAESYDGPSPSPFGQETITLEGTGDHAGIGGALSGQLHPERCTRAVCFLQHQIEEQAATTTTTDTQDKSPPCAPMLGDFWKATGAYVETRMSCAMSLSQFRYGWAQQSNEWGASGLVASPVNATISGGTTWQSTTYRFPLTGKFQSESDHPFLASAEALRRQAVTPWDDGGTVLSSWSWWFTVQNHKFTIAGSVREDNAYFPVADADHNQFSSGSDRRVVDVWSEVDVSTSPDTGSDVTDKRIVKIASVPIADQQGGKNYFLAYAHESYRDVWATCDATTYPTKNADLAQTPGNGNDFSIVAYTAAPGGGGGLLVPPAGGTYVR